MSFLPIRSRIEGVFCGSLICLFLLLTACQSDSMQPILEVRGREHYLSRQLAPCLVETEAAEGAGWEMERKIGSAFSKEGDFYRAVTAYKRAKILLPATQRPVLESLDYKILGAYYQGAQYQLLLDFFGNSSLVKTLATATIYHDLLWILFDAYDRLGFFSHANTIDRIAHDCFPDESVFFDLYAALRMADWGEITGCIDRLPKDAAEAVTHFCDQYDKQKKSVLMAQLLNGACPGMGYWYIGQKQSAMTAFLLNSLFIVAAYGFFSQGDVAAGIIFSGFELGWYVGGVVGVGMQAKLYNERLYERLANPMMNTQKIFPELRLHYGF